MTKLKVLITGVSGFIGLPLVERLANQGCEVLALSRTKPSFNAGNSVSWLEADLTDFQSYRFEIELFSPEIVIHLAWQDIPDFSLNKSINNLNASLEFLAFVVSLDSCKKILVSGSCWEYNRSQGECGETDIVAPKDHFTWAKNSIRTWLEVVAQEKNIIIGWLRIFYVYGPGQRSDALIPTILNEFKIGNLPNIKTPTNANDYIFLDDVVEAFALATTRPIPSGVYNLGSGVSTSVLEICRTAEWIVLGSENLTQKLEIDAGQNTNNINFWASIEGTKKILNWQPITTINSGIKNTWKQINKS